MRVSPALPAVVAAAVATLYGCSLPLEGLPPDGVGGAATTSGTATSTASGTVTSTSSGPSECATKSDCKPDGKCASYDCMAGKCARTILAEGVTIEDASGNCAKTVCVGGELTTQNDDADSSDDSNPCTLDGCSGGAATHVAGNDGDTCGNAGHHCFGGQCLDCATPAQCPQGDPICQMATCENGLCGLVDASEGAPCAKGSECTSSGICASGSCVQQKQDNGTSCAVGFGKCVEGDCCTLALVCGNGGTCCKLGQLCISQQCVL